MTDCSTELKRLVPLYRVVSAAIVDMHEDQGKMMHVTTHHAARGLRKLDREVLRTTPRSAVLTINRNTNTATLPPDFDEEYGVYVIVDGRKIPLKLRPELVDSGNMNEIACDDTKCPKCAQDTKICNDLTITEDTSIVIIHDSPYEQTVIKKLYPDGSYYLETRIPVWDEEDETVIYTTQKEFITSLDLKPCGCIEESEENIQKIKTCAYDVYCQYYTPCDYNCQVNYGGYKIFEHTNLIQLDAVGSFKKLYIEYYGFMPKKNGQYMVPEVAFETLVNWCKFKWIENKRNVPRWERQDAFDHYRRERSNMERIIGRISLSAIIQSIGLIPKFDIEVPVCDPVGYGYSTDPIISSSSTTSTSGSGGSGLSSSDSDTDTCESTNQTDCPPLSGKGFYPFDIAKIAGVGAKSPIVGVNYYQDDKLKGALGVNMIVVNNSNENIKAKQFTIDTTSGTIYRWQGDGVTPNKWQDGDILIVPTFFKIQSSEEFAEATLVESIESKDTIDISGPYEYVIDALENIYVFRVAIKPAASEVIRIGTTSGGDEIMFDELVAANDTKGVNVDVYSGSIFFTLTGDAEVTIYKRKL